MRKRTSPTTIVTLTALFFSLTGAAIASTIQFSAPKMTSRFQFNASPRRVETECEPTSARSIQLGGHAYRLPQLLENHARNGTVYVFERRQQTCASVVNWTGRRTRVHFILTLLGTHTRATDAPASTADISLGR